jgi:hypothetical protein
VLERSNLNRSSQLKAQQKYSVYGPVEVIIRPRKQCLQTESPRNLKMMFSPLGHHQQFRQQFYDEVAA